MEQTHKNQDDCCAVEKKPRWPYTKLTVLIVVLLAMAGLFILLRYTPLGASLVFGASAGGTRLLPLIVFSAFIDSINPCAFSVLLLTIAFLFSLGRVRGRILAAGIAYIAGLFGAYLLIGLGLLQALHLFNTPHFVAKVGALLLLLLGLAGLVSYFFPNFPIKFKIPSKAHGAMSKLVDRATLPTALLLGALVGLCEFPCTGGPYLTALGLLHDQTTYVQGFAFLLLYNAVFVLPLVLMLLLASDRVLLGRVQAWQQRSKRNLHLVAGIAMVILGLLIFFL